MANTFKRQTSNSIGSSYTTVYTVPGSTTTVIIGGVVSNTGTGTVNVEVAVNDGTNDINLTGKDTPIPAGTALSFIDKGSVANELDVMLSIMEIT